MSEYAVGGGKVDQEGFLKYLLHVYSAGTSLGMYVTQNGSGDMSVNVNLDTSLSMAGALIPTSANVPYYGYMDAIKNVTVTTADPSNPRKDIVVAYIDLSLITTSTTNNLGALKFKAVAGTPASSPTDPSGSTIQSSVGAGNPYIQLARLSVGTGVTQILNANITDLRISWEADRSSGWIKTDNWTYVSSTSMTVSAIDYARMDVGTKIKLTQTTVKYFYVASKSGGNTINLVPTTDYTLANAAITSPYLSNASTPVGFPSAFNYQPSWTGITAAQTGVFRYWIKDRICTVAHTRSANGTSNATSFTVTGPLASANIASMIWRGSGGGTDNNSNLTSPILCTIAANTTTINLFKDFAGSAWTSSNAKGADIILSYEV